MARLVSRTTIFRSERYAAIALAFAAVLGLLLANSFAGPALIEFFHQHLSIPALRIDYSIAHWVTDGLLTIFFFLIAIELRHELTKGELNSFQHALAPAVAAIGGVVVPALFYVGFVAFATNFGSQHALGTGDVMRGWPIPTATDIAFALGLIALIGKGLPTRIRSFLLALAVLDDLLAILIIAIFFTDHIDLLALGMAVFAVYVFRYLSCRAPLPRGWRIALMIVVAVLAWYFTVLSGVHPTIAGVALGLVLRPNQAQAAAQRLLPVNNAIILPLFAFVSALVVIPQVTPSQLSPAFWGITLALPLGKLVGIMGAGSLVVWVIHLRNRKGNLKRNRKRKNLKGAALSETRATLVTGWDLLAVAGVGGIGFTVSLLMNELAFAADRSIADQGVLAVLTGSAVSIVLGGVLIAWRARRHRRAIAGPSTRSPR